jgi:hypothetical protein
LQLSNFWLPFPVGLLNPAYDETNSPPERITKPGAKVPAPIGEKPNPLKYRPEDIVHLDLDEEREVIVPPGTVRDWFNPDTEQLPPDIIPAEVAAEVPAEVQTQIPVQIPVEVPAQTPAEVPAQTPAQTQDPIIPGVGQPELFPWWVLLVLAAGLYFVTISTKD